MNAGRLHSWLEDAGPDDLMPACWLLVIVADWDTPFLPSAAIWMNAWECNKAKQALLC